MRLQIKREYQKLNYTPGRQPVKRETDLLYPIVIWTATAIFVLFTIYVYFGGTK